MAHRPVGVDAGPLRSGGVGDTVTPTQAEAFPPTPFATPQGVGAGPARKPTDGSGAQGASVALLVTRARVALWTVIASNAFFAVTDLRLSRAALLHVLGLKLLQVAAVALALRGLRTARSRGAVVAIVLFAAACISGLTAWSGAVADDTVTTMILWLAVPFGTAALMPWGAGPQSGLVVIAGLAMLLNVALAHGTLAPALGYPGVGVLVTLGISVALAHEFERQRRMMVLENIKRQRAEQGFRQAYETLERRVQERTQALGLANLRLQEARDMAQADQHRFRTVSTLTADYAYTFRVQPGRPAVVEWLSEPSFERVTGYSTAEVSALGGGLALLHSKDLAIAAQRIESLLAGHADVSEFRIVRKDGSVRWIREYGYPEWDAAHTRVVRIFGAAQDITERRETEERLAEALRQRENVMNTVPDIIYTLDCQGRLLDWNRRLESVTGWNAAALAGRSALDVFEAGDRDRVALAIQHALATDYAEVEAHIVTPAGGRLYQFTGVPLRDQHGTLLGLTGVGRDIVELKRLQERNETLLEVARDVGGTLELHAIVARVQQRTAHLLPCDMVATFYWDAKREGFCAASHCGVPPALEAALAQLRFSLDTPFGGGLAAGETLVLEDLRQLPDIAALVPTGTLIAAPLHVRGRHLGALVALKTGAPRFEPTQIALCEGIAAQLAVALEVAELYQSQREEAHVSSALARAGQELISALNTPNWFDHLCRLTVQLLECDASFTLLSQAAERTYLVAAGHGFSDEQWESLRLLRMPGEAVDGLLSAFAAEAVVQTEMESAPTRWAALPAQYGLTVALYVPLRRGAEIVGILGVGFRGRRGPFTPQQQRIAQGIAQLASLALEHARAREVLEEASRLKSEFVATMSHELRTPLNIVLGYNDMLLSGGCGPLSAEQTEILGRSNDSARELLRLITDTLDLSRLEAGRVVLKCTDVSLPDLIREVEADTRGLHDESLVRLVWDVPDALPRLRTDAGKLKVVIKNIVINALKFTEQGAVTVRIACAGTRLEICVQDTGIGIPSSALGWIFEPFRQADSSMTRRHGGVGLGLYIVRRLLDLLGGTIEVTSQVDVGTTFRIRLPLAPARRAGRPAR